MLRIYLIFIDKIQKTALFDINKLRHNCNVFKSLKIVYQKGLLSFENSPFGCSIKNTMISNCYL